MTLPASQRMQVPHAEAVVNMQVEEAAAERHRQLAGHVEELERQLEGASHDLEEWQTQAADASNHAQQLQQQLQALGSRAEHAEVGGRCSPGAEGWMLSGRARMLLAS